MLSFTYEDEAGSDEISQYIASDRFIVSPVTFAKEANERVELVLTQTLAEKQRDKRGEPHISNPLGRLLGDSREALKKAKELASAAGDSL